MKPNPVLELIAARPGETIEVTYRNYRDETTVREIFPLRLWYGATPWHPEPGYLLTALDVEKQEKRDFCLADMSVL